MRRIYDDQSNKFVLSWFFTKPIDFLKWNGKFKCGHKDVKIFNKVLKLTQLLSIFTDDLGSSLFDWDFKIFFTCCGLLELWGMRNLELTTPKGTTVPNHSLRLPRIELHNPKVWSQNCLFQKYKTRDWLNNIYYGAIHSVTLVAARINDS